MPDVVPFRPLPVDLGDVTYAPGPDSSPQPGVPHGTVTELTWDSAIYPGAARQAWVHAPAAHDPTTPAALVVFQDGAGFLDEDDDLRAGVVLDNLVHDGDLPAMIGVFVEPGEHRNAEYDAADDTYARFLVEEVLPRIAERWSVSDDPTHRVVAGFSSGGNAAFTAAWHRPDAFGRVLAFLPSFPQLPGGNPYPAAVPVTEPKALRIFLQTAHRDLGWDDPQDNWLAETLRTTATLVERGYDVRLVVGDGGHTSDHAGALLPDALKWLLRG